MIPQETVDEGYTPFPNCVALTRYFYPPSERSDAVLAQQLEDAEQIVNRVVVRPLQPHQWQALICLVSDVVAGLASSPTPFEESFLVKAINKGMLQIAAAEFYSFCYVQRKVQTRAWEKRRAEAYLFSQGRMLFGEGA